MKDSSLGTDTLKNQGRSHKREANILSANQSLSIYCAFRNGIRPEVGFGGQFFWRRKNRREGVKYLSPSC